MQLEAIVEYIEIPFNAILILRLFLLRLGKVYAIFAAYLFTDLFGLLIASLYRWHHISLDYRLFYVVTRVVAWILSVWVVYALLNAMLKSLPGILSYSRRLLNIVFSIAFLVGVLAAGMSSVVHTIETRTDDLDRLVTITFAVDQTIGITILLVLVTMLCFFLWFPVVVPRNLAVFSIGYVVYFLTVAASLLLQNLEDLGSSPVVNVVLMLVTSVCYAYWAIFLSKAGESIPVRIGHSWQADEQKRLVHRLEEVNGVLLQTLANKKAV